MSDFQPHTHTPAGAMAEQVGGRALVLFSGGQDSATCLAWALRRYGEVETVGFDYGQRHVVELEAREAVRARLPYVLGPDAGNLGADHMVDLRGYGAIADSALTRDQEIGLGERGLPTTFVPARNLVFLTVAAAIADRIGAQAMVGGMCETDHAGYPDCRAETLGALEQAISLGLGHGLRIETPLMHLTKAGTWQLAHSLGGAALVELIVEHSHTCYRGERGVRHAWGYGCGTCPACELRAQGHREAGL